MALAKRQREEKPMKMEQKKIWGPEWEPKGLKCAPPPRKEERMPAKTRRTNIGVSEWIPYKCSQCLAYISSFKLHYL